MVCILALIFAEGPRLILVVMAVPLGDPVPTRPQTSARTRNLP